ncbi:ABC-type Co2+ transport system periplasmic component-like protein [Rhodopirellula sp. SWK7]|nr:ABC-type Co2+ transport system periplasmic component-like protein [Rhodopirellula sp. SWK7]
MKPSMTRYTTLLAVALSSITIQIANAHDVWLQTQSPVIRTGEIAHVDLRLGNHGNHHRDFKLAGRIDLDWVSVDHFKPDGTSSDLRDVMFTTASAEKEGYWTTPIVVDQPGMHCVVEQLDRVMQHGKSVRGIRTAKTYFLVADSLDSPVVDRHVHNRPLDLPFELVLQTCPITETTAGQPITAQVLHHGKPISDVVVSFIPEGIELTGEFDPEYEFRTDENGMVSFTPKSANLYLIVAHHTATDERSDEYEFTSYASTITLHVPNQICNVSSK